ncbi:MAG: Uncharacterized protein Athens071426_355 [Parcubacteria group bacterium Athens0714_26]|nr:MAG: Uncharacterized protein Athens101426_140 [Parcubacteria group bacterium Athens1014_26]TSD02935.1 MAG: Uncharacterized protein Athens071426_355 [Parcubacteria group bacterium Athens0714_26]
MKLKANLHFHAKEDPQDFVGHTVREGVDHAANLGFSVLAVTLHETFYNIPEIIEYAASRGILLILGAEIAIRKKHIVVLNCDKDVEKIRTFSDLENYKNSRPEIFILAPHPYFFSPESLMGNLDENIHLFDGIEYSWFYSKFFNQNKKAEITAKKHNLPIIATSDTHFLDFFDQSYVVLDAEEKTAKGVLKSLRQKKFENISYPRDFMRDMVWKLGKFRARDTILKLKRKFWL